LKVSFLEFAKRKFVIVAVEIKFVFLLKNKINKRSCEIYLGSDFNKLSIHIKNIFSSSFLHWAKKALNEQKFTEVFEKASTEISQDEGDTSVALLLRGTFHLLKGDHMEALEDLGKVVDNLKATDKVISLQYKIAGTN
jgi:hypothetical protein